MLISSFRSAPRASEGCVLRRSFIVFPCPTRETSCTTRAGTRELPDLIFAAARVAAHSQPPVTCRLLQLPCLPLTSVWWLQVQQLPWRCWQGTQLAHPPWCRVRQDLWYVSAAACSLLRLSCCPLLDATHIFSPSRMLLSLRLALCAHPPPRDVQSLG